ncbi:MAG: phosphoribosylaminoimidazolesuccinocarboxamide synthase [Desulfobacterales bacterium]|nr:phosphoribosylaminoimidazolesuccinocarboxamide synthase [Desulfobacterales bacterium]
MQNAIKETNFENLTLKQRGKVRDMYDLGDTLLMVASDRMSAFDVILPNPMPGKGKVLTQISLFWFNVMESLIANHIVSSNVDDYPEVCRPYADQLRDRSILVKKARPLPIECVVRGYISGSGWKDYQNSGKVCGIALPAGLQESDQLPETLFTPSTKAELGEHDENIDFEGAVVKLGRPLAEKVRDLSLAIYAKGAALALEKGIIIADTKFEFGLVDDELILIDEVLTPDSSRFWPKADYQPGGSQKSYDKQYLRDYLLTLDWDKTAPGPNLPEETITKTMEKYREALTQLTGRDYAL